MQQDDNKKKTLLDIYPERENIWRWAKKDTEYDKK